MSQRPLNLQLVIDILNYANQHPEPLLQQNLNPNGDEKDRGNLEWHFETLGDLGVVELNLMTEGDRVIPAITSLKPTGNELVNLFKSKEVLSQITSQFGQEINGNQLATIVSVGSKILGDILKRDPEKKAKRQEKRRKKIQQNEEVSFNDVRRSLLDTATQSIPTEFREAFRVMEDFGNVYLVTRGSKLMKSITKRIYNKGSIYYRLDSVNDIEGSKNLITFNEFVPGMSLDQSELKDLGYSTGPEFIKAEKNTIASNISLAFSSTQSRVNQLAKSYREAVKLKSDERITETPIIELQIEEGTPDDIVSISPEQLKQQTAQQEFAEPLQEVAPELPPEPPETIDNPLQLAHLNSDSAHKGKDLLGFEQDVEAFAAIMALEKLTPPLAIALFGQWGTGKSFFMQKLSEKVEELAKHQGFLREDDDEEEEDKGTKGSTSDEKPFCEGICQIHFNAWSYMDTNLWASLVTRIFEQLDDYINDNRTAAEQAVDTIKSGIAEQLDVAKGQIAELEARKAQVKNAIDTLQGQVTTAQEELEGKIEDIKTSSRKEVITAAIKASKIEESLKGILDKAGITQGKLDQVNPELILKELKSGQTFLRQFLNYSGWDWGLVGVGAVLLVITIFVLPELANLDTTWLNGIGSALGVLTAILSKVRGTTSKLSPLVNGVLNVKNDYDTAVNEAISKHEQEILAKQIEADQKEVELNQLNLQLKAKEAEIKEIEYKPDSVLAQKAMYNFITRKAASNDYSRHLGIISMIRKDFQTLSELFVESTKTKKVPKKSKEKYKKFKEIRDGFDKPLQRIVLYIDDLDRCPEERVVEVLEAVNLLMAFPLFVVVVGVDPRWVKNALIKKYHLQFTGRVKGSQQEVDSLGMEVINPSDYLEKIFQIPFHLKAPEDESIKNMISHLLGDAVAGKPEEPAPEEVETGEDGLPNIDLDAFFDKKSKEMRGLADELTEETLKAPESDVDSERSIPDTAPPEESVEEDEEAAEEMSEEETSGEEESEEEAETDIPPGLKVVTPESLRLHWEEGEYMRNLSWLIGNTPRTVKRFVNMYRIIRAHEGLSYEDDESKKDLLCIMFLLALQTGSYNEYEIKIKLLLPKIDIDVDNFGSALDREMISEPYFEEAQDKSIDTGYMNFLRRLSQSEELMLVREMSAHSIYCHSVFVERFRFNTSKIQSYPDFDDKEAFDPPEPPEDDLEDE